MHVTLGYLFQMGSLPELSSFLTGWEMVTTGTTALDQKQKHI